ncbi:hypothetical protein TNCV_2682221 [Trichonephila clavipes]|nr:hypothetical protein TNCV_2682221 [Trichonephila clavipes]
MLKSASGILTTVLSLDRNIDISGVLDHALNSNKTEETSVYLVDTVACMCVPGNKTVVDLTVKDCDLPDPSSSVLSHSEIHSLHRVQMNLTWQSPPAHYCYAATWPGDPGLFR